MDLRVLFFAAAAITATGLGFGTVPAMIAGGARATLALRDGARSGGGRKQRIRATLVAIEVMASVVLLVSSGLLVRAMWRLQSVDPGFRTEGVLTLRTALPQPRYAQPSDRAVFFGRVLTAVRALPGVQAAAYITGLPMAMRGGIWPVSIQGKEVVRTGSNTVSVRFATPQFFAALQVPILQGRDIQDIDDDRHPLAAVVSESFVARHWPKESALGKRFKIGGADRTVVGVASDIRVRGLERTSEPQVYLPTMQTNGNMSPYYVPKDLVIRSTSSAASLLPELRRIIHAADPQQPISNVQTMGEIVASETASRAAQLRVLGILAAIALLLAGVGIHGLLSFTVSRRTQEIGVRVALGAQSGEILTMVLREGLVLSIAGIVPGAALGYASGRAMDALLVGVRPSDPVTMSIAIGLCCAVTLVGCARPALRASRVDPMAALRSE